MGAEPSIEISRFQVVRSTLDAASIAEIVQTQYPVGIVQNCTFLRRGFNDIYEVRLSDGKRRIARLNALRARGLPNIHYELSLLQHLKAGGVAVGAPLHANDGSLTIDVLAPEGRRAFALFDFLEGIPPGESLGDIALTGAELARIHSVGRSYDGPKSRYQLDADHLVSKPLARILALEHVDSDVKERLDQAAASLIQSLAGSSLSIVACHGDCHGGNSFAFEETTGRRRASFFDFDDCGPGFLAYDLAVFLWATMLGRNLLEPDEKLLARWSAFIEGYREFNGIPEPDYAAIGSFVSIRQFWFMGEYAGNVDRHGTQAIPSRWFRQMADLLIKWQALVTPT